jgi:hypothetical protein
MAEPERQSNSYATKTLTKDPRAAAKPAAPGKAPGMAGPQTKSPRTILIVCVSAIFFSLAGFTVAAQLGNKHPEELSDADKIAARLDALDGSLKQLQTTLQLMQTRIGRLEAVSAQQGTRVEAIQGYIQSKGQ